MAVFIRHESCEKCGSSDAKAVYDDGSWHCFSCRATKASDEYLEEVQEQKKSVVKSSVSKIEYREMQLAGKELITENEIEVVVENTSVQGKKFRGIKDETYQKYGVRHQFSESTGQVEEQFYPITKNSEPAGYKVRVVPKTFYSIGATGKECDLFGQRNFKHGGKHILLTEGECFLPTTNILTRDGWVSLEEYSGGEVMQANGEFAEPLAIVKKDYTGELLTYKSGSFEITTTPEHNMIREKTSGERIKCKANDLSKKHLKVPRTVNFESNLDNLHARLQVMLSADFSFRKEGDIYGCLKKQRKIERCKELLNKANVKYSCNIDSRGYSSFYIHRGHGLDVSKKFSYIRDLQSAQTIIDEVVHWDGNYVPNRNQIEYSSVILGNAQFIQTCAHLCGYVSSIIQRSRDKYSWYKVSILFGKNSSSTQKGGTYHKYSGKVMCLTMPDGSLLVKQGDSISVSGNCDALSAYQMLKDYYEGRGMHYDVPCVSATTGANSFAQLQNQYKFFDLFENIYVCLDNDKAGEAALEDTIKALPKGKVKIVRMQLKDPNEYLTQGRQKEFVSAYFEAKTYVPDGIIGSGALYDKMLEYALVERVPLPPFMKKLDNMLGGVELGSIGIFAAATGAGKTSVVNELLYFWLFNSPHKIGVVSLELTCAQYGQVLLSRHIQQRISSIRDNEEKNAFLRRDVIKSKAMELFYDTEGDDRFMVIDERDGQLSILQDKIEELVISCGCKIIILDPVSDLMDGLSNDEQALFNKWTKSMIKNYNITFIHIAHIRKSGNNKDAASTGAFIPEEAIMGSSTLMKGASWIVMMQRDKYNADDIIRNTTILTLSKNRSQGETGPAGEIYYDGVTHTLHDKETYFIEKQPDNV